MKIVVTAQGQDLDAMVDPRFGRCQYFLFIDTDSLSCEAQANPGREAGGGAGIQAAQSVVDRGVEAVVTGFMGPNASRVLQASGVKVYGNAAGTVRGALEKLREGKLTLLSGPSVREHFGLQNP
ncbi:MAG: NifB/NifX family molybdenum-iron cluster-binding protein [bacterium]|nr:NifB/NifX family molybdenum-iron cluster-binding protein [bacterium]